MVILARYIRETMSATDQPKCQVAASKPLESMPHDFFARRRAQFRAAMMARCYAAATTVAEYRQLRSLFTSRLAGRYPFVDSASTKAPDADPLAIRDFLKAFDAFMITGPVSLQSDPRLANDAKGALVWLDQITAMRPFFAPFVDSGVTRRVPEYTLLVATSAAAAANGATEQRMLDIGSRGVPVDAEPHEEGWVYSEPITLAASTSDSPVVKAVFASPGGWSILRLATRNDPDVRVRLYHPDTKIELMLPVFPSAAPDIGPPPPAPPKR